MQGLHESTSTAGGTSEPVFSDWPQDRFKLYGKTGTAERPPHADQSWYAAFVNDPKQPIVIVTTVEDGGFGAAAAAPATCLMLKYWYKVKASCTPGNQR